MTDLKYLFFYLFFLIIGIFFGLIIHNINEPPDIKYVKQYMNNHVDSIVYVIGYDYKLQEENKLWQHRLSNKVHCVTLPDKSKFVNYRDRIFQLEK